MQLVDLFLRFVNVCLRNRELEVWPQVTAYILSMVDGFIIGVEK